MRSLRTSSLMLLALLLLLGAADAGQERLLNSFEKPSDLRQWEVNAGTPRLVAEHVTHGAKALEITFDPKGRYGPAYMTSWRLPRDWSAWDALQLDVFNPNAGPIRGYLLVADQAWRDKGSSYWNRHNSSTTFGPGRTMWTIPVRGLYRGEAGSRNNDIKRNIDPDKIIRVDFSFGNMKTTGRVVIDNLRLVKGDRPKGVWAFDFGPPSQSAMLGWTPVTHNTRYPTLPPPSGEGRGGGARADRVAYGWGPRGGTPWNGAARDTTFGPALLRDFCEARGYNFTVAVPPGKYRALVIYENSGYWGGEQAKHSWRRIFAGGREVWKEQRPDGPAHALYRFENVEPVPSDLFDLWDTYMKDELAKPIFFEAEAGRDGLSLRFDADVPWGSKLACLALHRLDDEAAAKWLADQLEAVEKDFRSKAVCLDKPALMFKVSSYTGRTGLHGWPTPLWRDVTPNSGPYLQPVEPLTLARLAVRGETEAFCFAVRPVRDLGECRLALEPLKGPGRVRTEVHVVWYNTSRGFGQIAYRVKPHTVRRQTLVRLPKAVTREVIITARVPEDAAPGTYRGALVLWAPKGNAPLRVHLELNVRPVTLDRQTDFQMSFFGLMPPGLIPAEKRWDVLDKTLAMLREYGMNQLCGGPSWTLKGWKNGEPVIDYGEMDRFFDLCRKHGFAGPHNGYGGLRFRGLHDRYQKGRSGERAERESGLPYQQTLLKAWGAVAKHAKAHNWPLINYAMCDETRVRDVAERQLDFMQMMAKVSAAYPDTLRTSGSYSVHFNKRPTDKNDLLYWHQRFFEALDISDLNSHDPSVMAEAKRLGKTVHIYNQGRTRYSFGLYQWSEYRKGIRCRTQWHLNILHGYQFFDLDGREPDTAMICYGRKGIYPTIHFERCREGAEDFYLYNTLWKLIEKQRAAGNKSKALAAAVALLDGAIAKVKLNQRRPPQWFDPGAFKAKVIAAIEALQKE